MSPSDIRFSQSDIKYSFTQGDDVHEVIDNIKRGWLSIQDFLPMNVAFYNGRWYTENNRTLYVCRVLQYEGKLKKVEVKEVSLLSTTATVSDP